MGILVWTIHSDLVLGCGEYSDLSADLCIVDMAS